MDSSALLYPMVFHVGWTALLYVALTVLRAPTIWGLDTRSGRLARRAAWEPRVSANLSNQFEWPLLFYVCCVLLLQTGKVDPGLVLLAWIFVAGRVVHSFVQILMDNIRLRGLVFTINFLAVLLMWGWLLGATL